MANERPRLSPVTTTRSGSGPATDATQSCFRRWPGVMSRSDRCRIQVEYRYIEAPQREEVAFDQAGVGERGRAEEANGGEEATHAPRLIGAGLSPPDGPVPDRAHIPSGNFSHHGHAKGSARGRHAG